MLATLVHETFSKEDWIYERKFDGVRCIAVSKDGDVKLYSRNEEERNATYPEIVDNLTNQKTSDFIIDGEIVAFEGDVTSFSRLQNRMKINDEEEARNSNVAVYYYVFDVLHADGYDVANLPLNDRKQILRELLDYEDRIRLTQYRREEGEKYHEEACEKGWEGVIAKDFSSRYMHSRSKKWLKFKCVKRQELVIGGFTDPEGSRKGFGALLVGFYDNGDLRYAGKIGTGYDDKTLVELRDRMDRLERESSPFEDEVKEKNAHFIRPELVAEIGFTEWTEDNKLRHPRFVGLRRDKDPKMVVKEEPE